MSNAEYEVIKAKFDLAEEVLIAWGDVAIDHDYQMRSKMNHANIDDYAEHLDDLPPVHIFEINGKFLLVDGFHRYFAHEQAGAADIRALVIKGTQREAMIYAMVTNFEHLRGGTKPTKADQANAIRQLCETMREDFGLDPTSVVPTLRAIGITATPRYIRECTALFRDRLTDERNEKIIALHESGRGKRDVAREVGCDEGTVRNVVAAAEKRNSSEIPQEPTYEQMKEEALQFTRDYEANPEAYEGEDVGFVFSEEDINPPPVINPADARVKAVAEFEAKMEQRAKEDAAKVRPVTATTDSKTSSDNTAPLTAADTLFQTYKAEDKDTFKKFLKGLDEDAKQTAVQVAQTIAMTLA